MSLTLIESKTITTTATALQFTSIPQDGTDLLVLISSRATNAFAGENHLLRFNGSTASIYTSRLLFGGGSGSGNSASVVNGEALFWAPTSVGGGATANTFNNASIYIPNYTSSSVKSMSTDAVGENNATGARQDLVAHLWNNTAAITSMEFSWETPTNLAIGSTFSLYKITKGSDGIVTTS